MAKKEKESEDVVPKYTSVTLMSLFAAFMGLITLFLYVNHKDPSILVFGFIIIVLSLGLHLFIDFLKSAAIKGMDHDVALNKKDDKVMERIENLEALMCRLDAEINSQLEQTLSA